MCVRCWSVLPDAAAFCAGCGLRTGREETSVPRVGDWSEERKLATILFGDIVGFTAISAKLEPDDVWDFASICLEPLAREIERRGGTVVKYIGDCIMAVFGVPVGTEDDPLRAVRAAVEMSEQVAHFSHEIERRYGSPISMRIGVNTGLVMAGAVGGGSEARRDVMGTAVNIASRIERVAGPGEVVVGPATYRLVRNEFKFEALGPVVLKGLADPVPVYRVLEQTTEPDGPAAEVFEDGPLNLRELELDQLLSTWDIVARRGEGRVVKLLGDSGMGKNWLTRQLQQQLEDDPRAPEVLTTWGYVSATTSTAPMWMVGRMIRGRFAVRPDEPVQDARERVVAGIAAAWGVLEEAEGLEAARRLADVAALNPGDEEVAGAAPTHTIELVLSALVSWIEHIAQRRPVCLFLQELQWADDRSLDVLEQLTRRVIDLPVMVVLTAEPVFDERRPGYGEASGVMERVELGALPAAKMRGLVDHLVREVPDFPEEVKDELVARSEGNPEYAKELVRWLADKGAMVVGREGTQWQWRPERLGELALPETIQGVLQARLDSLPPEDKEVLKRASVAGRIFWEGAVVALTDPADQTRVAQRLATLVAKRHVQVREPSVLEGEREYSFRSQSLRDITYRSIPGHIRRVAHLQVASWLRARGELWEGGDAELAGHLEAGDALDEACVYYLKAARHASRIYAHEEAAKFFERAIALWSDDLDLLGRAVARREQAVTQSRLGKYSEALEALDAATEDLHELAAPSMEFAWVELDRARILKERGRTDASMDALDAGLRLMEGAAPSALAMQLLATRAYLKTMKNDLEAAREDCELGMSLGRQVSQRDAAWRWGMALLANNLGIVHLQAGELEEAEQRFLEGQKLNRQLDNVHGRLIALIQLGAICFDRGEVARAARFFEEALAVANKTRSVKEIAVSRSNLGQARLAAGQIDAAITQLEEGRRLALEAGLLDVLADSGRALAAARLIAGAVEPALEDALTALEHASRTGIPRFEALAHGVVMDCYLSGATPPASSTGRDAAHRHLEQAIAIFRSSQDPAREKEIASLQRRYDRAVEPQDTALQNP